jgi:hypothetical protein
MRVNVVDRSCTLAFENEPGNLLISVPLKVRDRRKCAVQCLNVKAELNAIGVREKDMSDPRYNPDLKIKITKLFRYQV